MPLDEVEVRLYKTLDKPSKLEICSLLMKHYSVDILKTIPGLYFDNNSRLKMAGCYGLLIPVRTYNGDIVALKIRTNGHGRYLYLSSKSKGGPSSGSHLHFPWSDINNSKILRITEGELKADIVSHFSGDLTVSIPGVNSWRKVIPAIEYLEPELVKIAFDNDFREKEQVARSLLNLAGYIKSMGIKLELELW